MADKKISALTEIENITDVVYIPLEQNGVTKKILGENLSPLSKRPEQAGADDLVLIDGTRQFGLTPETDGSIYIEPYITLDGVDYQNPFTKFEGKGERWIGDDYTNYGGDLSDWSLSGGLTTEDIGGWTVLNSAAGDFLYKEVIASTDGFMEVIIKRVDSDSFSIAFFDTGRTGVKYVWDTDTTTVDGATPDTYQVEKLADGLVAVRIMSTAITAGTWQFKIYPEQTTGVGSIAVYNKPIVTTTPYPVPYVADTHTFTPTKFSVDWEKYGDDLVIEGWFYWNGNTDPCILIETRTTLYKQGMAFYRSAGNWYFECATETASQIVTSAPNIGFNHFRITKDAQTSLTLHLNNVLRATITSNIPINESMCNYLRVGSDVFDRYPPNGQIIDLRISGDTTSGTDHYTSGLPWARNDRTYHKEGGEFSVSKAGDVTARDIFAKRLFLSESSTDEFYETGEWSPTDESGAGLTLTVNSAEYTKIGNQCICKANVTYPATSDTNQITIGGFPFAMGMGSGFMSSGDYVLTAAGRNIALNDSGNNAIAVNISSISSVVQNAYRSDSSFQFIYTYTIEE